MNTRKIFISLCAAIAMSPVASLHATNVIFSGSLAAATPCELNHGEELNVSFGDLVIRDINGTSYKKKDVPLSIVCDNNTHVTFRVNGTPTIFSGSALTTNISALGIALEFGGVPLQLNSEITASSSAASGTLMISAIPVLDPGASLSTVPAETFSASAQILATYD